MGKALVWETLGPKFRFPAVIQKAGISINTSDPSSINTHDPHIRKKKPTDPRIVGHQL